MSIDFTNWTVATAQLKPGQQAVFLDMLNLVKDGKVHLVHGADYRDGKPCLVNGVATMLSQSSVSPMEKFPYVVSAFDVVCGEMANAGLSEGLKGYVSPLMAEFLIRNFGEVKPIELTDPPVTEPGPYVEPSDAEMAAMLEGMLAPAPEDISDGDNKSPEVEYTRSFVNVEPQ